MYPFGLQPMGGTGEWPRGTTRAATANWQAKIKSKAIENTLTVLWIIAFVKRYAIGVDRRKEFKELWYILVFLLS